MGPEALGGDGLDGGLLAQTGHGEGVPFAHDPYHPVHGVGLLVVELRLDGGNQVFLLAFYIFLIESPVFQYRVQ